VRSERHHGFAGFVRREHLEVLDSRPLAAFDPNCFDRGRSDETTVHGLQLVRTVLVKTDTTTVVDPETDTTPPAEPSRSASDLLDLDSALDAAKPPKLLSHQIGLQVPLRRKRDVLPVTAPASPRARKRTRRRHPLWEGLDDLERVRSEVGPGFLGYRREDALAGQAMADEHDTTIVSSRDTTTARCDPASFQLQQRGVGHGTTTFRPSCEFGHVLMVPPVDCGSSTASSPRPHPLSLPTSAVGERHCVPEEIQQIKKPEGSDRRITDTSPIRISPQRQFSPHDNAI
jgi:hypothetical protein